MHGSETREGNPGGLSKRELLAAAAGVGTTLLAGCLDGGGSTAGGGSGDGTGSRDGTESGDGSTTDTESMADSTKDGGSSTDAMTDGSEAEHLWRSVELSTVRDEETFTIESLDGPVVVQSFAVWCPRCERQSNEIADLDDSVTAIGLNTDPNEDAEKVRQHAEAKGFDWRFAVATTEMTESLIAEFGTSVADAPSTPIIVDCGDGSTAFDSGFVLPAEDAQALAEDC